MHNPIEIIKTDHRKLEELFKQYEDIEASGYATKEKIAKRITRELKLHMEMEEKVLYPYGASILNDEDEKLIEEGIAEHDVAKRILEELSVTHPEDLQFDARIKVLNENTAHHIIEEEEELLPLLEKSISGETLGALGEEMHNFRIIHDESD